MINILSYVGISNHTEICVWTILGLLRCIFDATLFKFDANLKQVWHMSMPPPLPAQVARVLRTLICGVMFVQYFTIYLYLASYIILLYPVFLEERSTLVLPWLLLTALRQLLCELLSLAMGLAVCVCVGPARSPCVKFVFLKIFFLGPWIYVSMLLFNYYTTLKAADVFKILPVKVPTTDPDYGIELAVRRRRTKSLMPEKQLRKILSDSFYDNHENTQRIGECPYHSTNVSATRLSSPQKTPNDSTTDTTQIEDNEGEPGSSNLPTAADAETCDDWYYNETSIPRDTDRVLEQFSIMMLRLATFIATEGTDPRKIFGYNGTDDNMQNTIDCTGHVDEDDGDTPPQIGSKGGTTAAYLRNYSNIFRTRRSEHT